MDGGSNGYVVGAATLGFGHRFPAALLETQAAQRARRERVAAGVELRMKWTCAAVLLGRSVSFQGSRSHFAGFNTSANNPFADQVVGAALPVGSPG